LPTPIPERPSFIEVTSSRSSIRTQYRTSFGLEVHLG